MSALTCLFVHGFESLPEVFDPGRPHEWPRDVRWISGPKALFGLFFRSWPMAERRKTTHEAEARKPSQVCEPLGPVQGSKSPKSGKEGFGVEKPQFPRPRTRPVWVRKSLFPYRAPHKKWGFSDSKPFSGFVGNGGPEGPGIEKIHSRSNAWKKHSPTQEIFILASNLHSRFENFILDWKFQSQALFFCGQRGARNENLILDWKFHSVGPLGVFRPETLFSWFWGFPWESFDAKNSIGNKFYFLK